jgi:hypothetical protein
MARKNLTPEEERLALTKKGWYQFFCGNFNCPTRLAGQLHDVHIDEMEDGAVWLCPRCHPRRKAT